MFSLLNLTRYTVCISAKNIFHPNSTVCRKINLMKNMNLQHAWFRPHCPKHNLHFGIISEPVAAAVDAIDFGANIHMWLRKNIYPCIRSSRESQARLLCGNSDYFWDSVHKCTYTFSGQCTWLIISLAPP